MPKESTYLRIRRLFRKHRFQGGEIIPILILGKKEIEECKTSGTLFISDNPNMRSLAFGLCFTKIKISHKKYCLKIENNH